MAQKGVPKDVGPGVFRDKNGDVIPRRKFQEDPDLDAKVNEEHLYVMGLRAGLPREPEVEKTLNQKLLAEYRPDLFGESRQS